MSDHGAMHHFYIDNTQMYMYTLSFAAKRNTLRRSVIKTGEELYSSLKFADSNLIVFNYIKENGVQYKNTSIIYKAVDKLKLYMALNYN